jgi:rhodanese-related sulfurtransferase
MFSFFKNLFKSINYSSLMARGAIIIDVRTGQEFDSGHIANAKNIPVDRIKERVADLKKMNVPVICCCASGMRSGAASSILKANGIEAYNGGGWQSLASKI